MIIENDIEQFYGLEPLKYPYLTSILLKKTSSGNGGFISGIELILSPMNQAGFPNRLWLRCQKAVDIKIGDVNMMYGMQIEIEDVRRHQLEGIIFKVKEVENNVISLLCNGFQAELIEREDYIE